MVRVELNGGLGNQLFQYAAGRRLALRHGVPLKFDVDSFCRHPLRSFRLDRFEIEATVASADERARFLGRGSLGRRVARLAERLTPYRWRRVLRERHFHFDPALLRAGSDVFLIGYWQSERYFADVAATIRREVTPRNPLVGRNAELAAQITAVDAVSLHVRRGDYVSEAKTNRIHGLCSPDYYAAALQHIAERVAVPHIFVFSDEPRWAAEHLHLGYPTTIVDHNGPDDDHEDLRLMSLCRHHIIANSSFSWWGAWLAAHREKIVVAPARWFAGWAVDTCDLLPPSWQRV